MEKLVMFFQEKEIVLPERNIGVHGIQTGNEWPLGSRKLLQNLF
jgi:hypothetical protein